MPKAKKRKYNQGLRKGFAKFLLTCVVPFIKLRYGVKKTQNISVSSEPFIMLYNHTTDLDMLWLMDAYHKRYIYCLGSEHIFRTHVGGKLIRFFFDPIFIKKGNFGVAPVMEMYRYLQNGRSILLAPEGLKSGNGLSCPILPSTAAVLQKLNCNVVTARIHGGFFTTPRWGRGVRKGQISVEKAAEYSKEEIAGMSREEFYQKIVSDLSEDAYAYNEEKKIAYKCSRFAEGIELELYICPVCKRLATIHSKGNEFFCDCGMKATLDAYYKIHGEGVPFTTIAEWDKWQNEEIDHMPRPEEGKVILSTPDLKLKEVFANHKEHIADSGELRITANEISVGNTHIPFTEISNTSMFGYGILLLSTKDKHYYEIKNKHVRYPGYLYLKLISIFKES